MSGSLIEKTYGDLKCLEANGHDKSATIVVLHGYGATEQDFAPLASMMSLSSPVRWIFVRAPLSIPTGPSTQGYAWFPIDVEALNQALESGTHRQFSAETVEGFESARDQILQLIKTAKIDPEKLVLCGFSQGAMLATEVALSLEKGPKALSILSGSYIQGLKWKERAAQKPALNILQSHGRADPLLSYTQAEALYRDFLESGTNIQFHGFDAGHEVPSPILNVWAQFLEKNTLPT